MPVVDGFAIPPPPGGEPPRRQPVNRPRRAPAARAPEPQPAAEAPPLPRRPAPVRPVAAPRPPAPRAAARPARARVPRRRVWPALAALVAGLAFARAAGIDPLPGLTAEVAGAARSIANVVESILPDPVAPDRGFTRPTRQHRVRPGESLSLIAARAGLSVQRLLDVGRNRQRFPHPDRIRPGQQVDLP